MALSAFTSAPLSISNSTNFGLLPNPDARCRGVDCPLWRALTYAPWFRSNSNAAVSAPAPAARCKGVLSNLSEAFTSDPASSCFARLGLSRCPKTQGRTTDRSRKRGFRSGWKGSARGMASAWEWKSPAPRRRPQATERDRVVAGRETSSSKKPPLGRVWCYSPKVARSPCEPQGGMGATTPYASS